MIEVTDPKVLETLENAVAKYELILVPGFKNSLPEHWQSFWEREMGMFRRISQSRWEVRDIDLWIDAIRRELSDCSRPAILIGHSLGALASAFIIDGGEPRVCGAMLVAPADPRRFYVEDRVPVGKLNVPTVLVASRNDKLATYPMAVEMAETWGSDLVDLGEAGHINSESGFGRWPFGLTVLANLINRIDSED